LVNGVRRLRRTGSLPTVARRHGVAGTAARRAHEHVIDREVASWWHDELTWRKRPGKRRRAGAYASAAQLEFSRGYIRRRVQGSGPFQLDQRARVKVVRTMPPRGRSYGCVLA